MRGINLVQGACERILPRRPSLEILYREPLYTEAFSRGLTTWAHIESLFRDLVMRPPINAGGIERNCSWTWGKHVACNWLVIIRDFSLVFEVSICRTRSCCICGSVSLLLFLYDCKREAEQRWSTVPSRSTTCWRVHECRRLSLRDWAGQRRAQVSSPGLDRRERSAGLLQRCEKGVLSCVALKMNLLHLLVLASVCNCAYKKLTEK